MEATVDICGAQDYPVLDDSRLAVLRDVEGDDGRPFIFEFIELFEADAEQRLEKLQEALRGIDLSGLRKLAHTLKGSCRNVGAMAMGEACLRLEQAAETCEPDQAATMVEQIAREYARVKEQLPAVLK